jgi:hypothetical protein
MHKLWHAAFLALLPFAPARAAAVEPASAIGAFADANPAPAPGDAPEDETVVVTGQARQPTRGDIAEQARQLAGASRKYDENLARFQAPVCPGVVGLKRAAAEMMIDRIRDNAARLGVPLAKARCSPNLLVALVEDGRSVLSELERNRPQMFGQIAASERSALLSDAMPVRVWNNIVTLGPDGAPVARDSDGREMLPSVFGYANRWFVKFHRDIISTLVLFDRDAVEGMTLVQLADYATMRGVAQMRPASGAEPMATILALFGERRSDTPELTSFDIGFLRSLYWEAANESAISKLLRIKRQADKARAEMAAP